jgi:hypothetical protein
MIHKLVQFRIKDEVFVLLSEVSQALPILSREIRGVISENGLMA